MKLMLKLFCLGGQTMSTRIWIWRAFCFSALSRQSQVFVSVHWTLNKHLLFEWKRLIWIMVKFSSSPSTTHCGSLCSQIQFNPMQIKYSSVKIGNLIRMDGFWDLSSLWFICIIPTWVDLETKLLIMMGYLIIDAKHKKVNLSQLLINLDMEDPVTGTTPKFGPNCRVFSSM